MGEPGPGRARLSVEYRAEWSRRHYGIDPARVPMLPTYLRIVGTLARPVRAVPPLAFTVAGAALAVVAILLAHALPWLALILVALATLCDALDGAVAALAGRASRSGAIADRIADRVADTSFALVIWRCGAPLWLAAVAGGLSLVHELIRELRGGALRSRITIAERPTRAICTALACIAASVSATTWPPTVCAAVWVGLALAGLAQLISGWGGPSTSTGRERAARASRR